MPYTAGVGDMTAIGRGLGQGMRNLASLGMGMMERGQERAAQEKLEAQKFEALRKYAEASGFLTKDQASVMSLPELEGTMRGKVLEAETKRQAEQAAAGRLKDAATMRYQDAMTAQMQGNARTQATDRAQREGFNRAFAQGIPSTWDGDAMARYARQGPARIAAEQFPGGIAPEKLIELDQQRAGGDATAPKAFNVGGTSGVYSPKTGQIIPQASEMTPAQKAQQISRLRAEERNMMRLLADPSTDPSLTPRVRAQMQALAAEIEALGGQAAPADAAPAPSRNLSGVRDYDPRTRRLLP